MKSIMIKFFNLPLSLITIALILFFACDSPVKQNSRDEILAKINQNTAEKMFLSFWNGMNYDEFIIVCDILVDENKLIKTEDAFKYTYNFMEDGDIHHASVLVKPIFDRFKKLQAIELNLERKDLCNEIVFTEELSNTLNKNPRMCVDKYLAKNIFNLYENKYGKPKVVRNPSGNNGFPRYSSFYDFSANDVTVIRIKESVGKRYSYKTQAGYLASVLEHNNISSGVIKAKPEKGKVVGEYIEIFTILYSSKEYLKEQEVQHKLNEESIEEENKGLLKETQSDI